MAQKKRDIRKWRELYIWTGQSLRLHGISCHPLSTLLIVADLLPSPLSLLLISHPSPLLPPLYLHCPTSLLPLSDHSPDKAAKSVQWLI